MAEGQSSQKIHVTVKTPKAKQIIEIDENADIKEVSSPFWLHRITSPLRRKLRAYRDNVCMCECV